ncbi:MAG: acetyl/propionyl/methylcrotonyl-CoA carboxylase subunit alpha [Candidatus Nanopelagicales bacterium]
MFDTVLVANRGEIAVRVIRTLRALGVRSVAVYSDADAGARHVREADEALRLGPAPAAESYLAIDRVLDAAVRSGAQAVHPGYGFLSENAAFARACADAGLVFVGPPVAALEAMGDKISAKNVAIAAGVPVVPGRHDPGMTDEDILAIADEVGYPLLLKPSAGGGGKGMRRVDAYGELTEALVSARRESRSAFGDDALLVERYVERPRHIEIQVLADGRGGAVHLGERECSLQRRHQKVVEEAPSALLDAATRDRMGRAAVGVAREVGYVGAGTVEFLVSDTRPDEFFFLEMNTRLQVEHPVTEAVTGLDLVELQLGVAAGEPLPFGQDDVRLTGHAVEARVYAEDPARGFLPTGGRVLAYREPDGDGVRVDSGVRAGVTIGSDYDPMLAKVVAWGPDRATALHRLDGALAHTVLLGVPTNLAFLRAMVADPEVRSGVLDTGLVERRTEDWTATTVPEHALAAAGLERLLALTPAGPVVDPWDVPSGWRPGAPAWATWRIRAAGADPVDVSVRGTATSAEVRVGDGPVHPASVRSDGTDLLVAVGADARRYSWARSGDTLWLAHGGAAWALAEEDRLAAVRAEHAGGGGPVRSPMPGVVIAVAVDVGSEVAVGDPLVTVEAMKMEHTLRAPVDGVVTELPARVGAQVRMDQTLAVVTAHREPTAADAPEEVVA